MIKKTCPNCNKTVIQLKHSAICDCGPRIVIRARN